MTPEPPKDERCECGHSDMTHDGFQRRCTEYVTSGDDEEMCGCRRFIPAEEDK